MTETTELVERAAVTCLNESFLPDHRDHVSKAEALGVAISNWSDWTADTIAEVFFSALEDCNYHTERAEFVLLWNDRHGTEFH